MCGVCGICVPEGHAPPDRQALESATTSLRHRGPDAGGFFFGSGVGLGHRRLSIIDLEGGDQPLFNEDRSVAVICNGEIYNYLELRADLEARGHRLATQSDTEVIAHLYEDRGAECVNALNGMFAIALWDQTRRELLLARDRLGEKPLYYHVADGVLSFASELKALLRLPRVAGRVSTAALDDYLAYGYVPGERCIVEGVRKLPAGHRLLWRNGLVRVEQYWDVRFERQPVRDEEDWLRELEDRLRASIRIRLRADVPLGVFLSGGVDSSSIVALAAQEAGGRLKTFSIGFREAEFDELHHARTVAERFSTDHHELVVGDGDARVLPELAYQLDEPLADPSVLPTYYVCREARKHVTVCLSGDGGDEVFAGYDRYVQALRYQRFDGLARLGLGRVSAALLPCLPRYFRGRGVLERLTTSGERRYMQQAGKFSADEREALYRPEVLPALQAEPWAYAPYFANGDDLQSSLQHADQKTYLPDDILLKVDRMSMTSSLEVRVPFLDHTLVDFVNAAPAELKLSGGVTKLPLRRLLRKHLPGPLAARAKRGFGIPIRNWFRGGLTAEVRQALLASDARLAQWLRPRAVAELLDQEGRGRRDLSRKVWMLLVLEHWCRAFKV